MSIETIRINLLAIPSVMGAALCLLGQSSAVAHHSANALYEMDSDFEIAGEVTEVRWNNPHVRVVVRVAEEGQAREWIVEGGDSSSMRARGVPGGLVEVGDSVRAAGRPGRRGKAAIFATNLLLADGREILLNSEAPPRWSDDIVGETGEMASEVPRREDATSGIFAVWSAPPGFEGDEEAGVWGGDIELTAEAAAIRDRFDPSADDDNPFISCTRGIPEIMTGLGPLEFVDQGDRILFRFQEFDIVRPIMMGPDAEADRPPKSEVGAHGAVGYSTGYWEADGTLMVRTTGMNFPYYDQSGLPQTTDAELVERWTLVDEGNALRYELTVTDPATFVRPVVQTKIWHWAPDRQIEPFNCDPVQVL